MAYAAEEVGLRGSQDIANLYKRDQRSVVAVAQFDMTGFPGAGDQIVFMSDFVNPDLTLFAKKLADTYVKVNENATINVATLAATTLSSWNKAGFPAIMPSKPDSSDNKNIGASKRSSLENRLDAWHSLRKTRSRVCQRAFSITNRYPTTS